MPDTPLPSTSSAATAPPGSTAVSETSNAPFSEAATSPISISGAVPSSRNGSLVRDTSRLSPAALSGASSVRSRTRYTPSGSPLASQLKKYPQILLNVPVDGKPPLDGVEPVQKACREAEEALSGKGRVVLRYSGTEPLCRVMVEGPDAKQVRALAERIADVVRSSIGKSATRTPSA